VDVAVVHWPAEGDRLDRLRVVGEARLLVIESGDPPFSTDPLEDWVRVPVHEDDLRLRIDVLRQRAALREPLSIDDGVLRWGDQLLILPPTEARIASTLLRSMNTVVAREQLKRSVWPDRPPNGRNALDVHIAKLRRLVGQIGIDVRTVHGRGYLMHCDPEAHAANASERVGYL
jgi:DNA-binding winged helix-turn-helix (wHTH) protein